MRVMLVDDEEELVSALAERLNIRNIETECFNNGSEALERAETVDFDVAVLDLKMPKISGIQLRDRLRKKQPYLRFIFLTGYGSNGVFSESGSEGDGSVFLAKPLDIDILIDAIRSVCGIKENKP